ncbi:MAG: IS256 family transposase [Gemmatimonadota bacterium]|nr:IS256 family transposase [Gemmatimonadota bacterium]MDQ8171107.1 IS256 family transposase [Gemmatimonadota bacterium]
MPRKSKEPGAAEVVGSVPIPAALLDELVKGPMSPTDVQALFQSFKQAVIERAMGAEMSHHLGYRAGEARPEGETNHRNGRTGKTVLTEDGPLRIAVPRDRDGTFEPILIPKHARRFTGFDDKIIAMYARGMTVREIQGFLAEQYGTQVSPDFISSVTDEVMAEVTAWQQRPLERMYPVIFFDALRVKIRDDGVVCNKAVYVALGVLPDGTREVLGLWIEQTEGAKFWLKVFNDLKTRGVQDVLIAVVDGLTGLADAIETAFPTTTVQTCIVHLLRNSLDYASWKDRKKLAAALRPIYTAVSAEVAEAALRDFAAGPWGQKHPTIVQSWQRAWAHVIPFFAFPPAVRRVIYTTNAIESLHMRLRKIIKTRGHFPTDDAALKLLWLALQNTFANTTRSVREWHEAMNQFAIFYGDRFTRPA